MYVKNISRKSNKIERQRGKKRKKKSPRAASFSLLYGAFFFLWELCVELDCGLFFGWVGGESARKEMRRRKKIGGHWRNITSTNDFMWLKNMMVALEVLRNKTTLIGGKWMMGIKKKCIRPFLNTSLSLTHTHNNLFIRINKWIIHYQSFHHYYTIYIFTLKRFLVMLLLIVN